MAKVLLVYGSETGNTKGAAEMIESVLKSKGKDVTVKDVVDTSADVMTDDWDLILLGVSTWGAIEDEVTEDFKNFYAEMDSVDLSGKKVGVFGSGDTGYENFCKAVDYVAERAAAKGADVVLERLKFNLDPETSKEAIESWAEQAAGKA